MERPGVDVKCGGTGCPHTFGVHYTAYDGKTTGCGGKITGQRDEEFGCYCKGFALVWKDQGNANFQPPTRKSSIDTHELRYNGPG